MQNYKRMQKKEELKWLDFPLKLLLVLFFDEITLRTIRMYLLVSIRMKELKFSYHERIECWGLPANIREKKIYVKIQQMFS